MEPQHTTHSLRHLLAQAYPLTRSRCLYSGAHLATLSRDVSLYAHLGGNSTLSLFARRLVTR